MTTKPKTYQADLSKLPRAFAPLIARSQWAIWRWTQLPNGKWQKPPFMATQPDRHASTNDRSTWADYATALAAWQAGHGDGISYVLAEADPYAAMTSIIAGILLRIRSTDGRRISLRPATTAIAK